VSYRVNNRDGLSRAVRAYGDAGLAAINRVIVNTTLYAQEQIIQQITVLGLVDTGRLRSSWTVNFPGPYRGKVSTIVEYAARLEYGFNGVEKVQAHSVKEHKRKMKVPKKRGGGTKTKIVTVKAHNRKAHKRKANTKAYYYVRYAAQKARFFLNKSLIIELRKLRKEAP
jgi:hypothetical protein